MTEKEHIKLMEIGNDFWVEFSALCEKYLAKSPPHLAADYEMHLSEKTSLYGRKK